MIDLLLGVPGKLKALSDYITTYWTAVRAAKLDYLDALTSSRAPASTALTNATWTDVRAGKLDTIGTDPSSAVPIAAGFLPSQSPGYAATNSLSYVNVLTINGTGILKYLAISAPSVAVVPSIELIIDGVTLYSGSPGSGVAAILFSVVGITTQDGTGVMGYDRIPYKTSLVVNAKTSNAGSGNVFIRWAQHRTA